MDQRCKGKSDTAAMNNRTAGITATHSYMREMMIALLIAVPVAAFLICGLWPAAVFEFNGWRTK